MCGAASVSVVLSGGIESVAVCVSMLQGAAVFLGVLECIAACCCSVLQ